VPVDVLTGFTGSGSSSSSTIGSGSGISSITGSSSVIVHTFRPQKCKYFYGRL